MAAENSAPRGGFDERLTAARDTVLEAGEQIVAQETGDQGQGIVLTSSRIITIKAGFAATGEINGERVGAYAFDEITAVKMRRGPMGAVLQFVTQTAEDDPVKNEVVVFSGDQKVKKCEAFAKKIEQTMEKTVEKFEHTDHQGAAQQPVTTEPQDEQTVIQTHVSMEENSPESVETVVAVSETEEPVSEDLVQNTEYVSVEDVSVQDAAPQEQSEDQEEDVTQQRGIKRKSLAEEMYAEISGVDEQENTATQETASPSSHKTDAPDIYSQEEIVASVSEDSRTEDTNMEIVQGGLKDGLGDELQGGPSAADDLDDDISLNTLVEQTVNELESAVEAKKQSEKVAEETAATDEIQETVSEVEQVVQASEDAARDEKQAEETVQSGENYGPNPNIPRPAKKNAPKSKVGVLVAVLVIAIAGIGIFILGPFNKTDDTTANISMPALEDAKATPKEHLKEIEDYKATVLKYIAVSDNSLNAVNEALASGNREQALVALKNEASDEMWRELAELDTPAGLADARDKVRSGLAKRKTAIDHISNAVEFDMAYNHEQVNRDLQKAHALIAKGIARIDKHIEKLSGSKADEETTAKK